MFFLYKHSGSYLSRMTAFILLEVETHPRTHKSIHGSSLQICLGQIVSGCLHLTSGMNHLCLKLFYLILFMTGCWTFGQNSLHKFKRLFIELKTLNLFSQ